MRIIFRCDPALVDYLPRPILARSTLPAWLKDMPAHSYSEIHGRSVRTVKQCPPFIDAMAHGFMVLLPCDIRVDRGTFSWNWPIPAPATPGHPRAPLSFHVPAQVADAPFAQKDQAVLKFNSFWTIELEEGWSLFATHPINRADLPFRLITGLVDSDRFHDGGINFPGVWTAPDFSGILPKGTPIAQCFSVPRSNDLNFPGVWTAPDFSGILPKGTPIAQCFSVPRSNDQLEFEMLDAAHQAAYSKTVADVLSKPGLYRKQFRASRRRSARK